MVFQNYALYPHMTVRDNMALLAAAGQDGQGRHHERVGKAAEILGLTPLLDRYPRQLSGGQRQRVAMGRGIVRDPQVFLFDEPLSNLDAKLRVQMRTEIKELHQRLKTTSIYVTHDQIEAMTMADQIVVMHDGRVEQIGSPLELYDNPANRFVAGFIGSPAMNFIDGKLDGARRLMSRPPTVRACRPAVCRRFAWPAGRLRHPPRAPRHRRAATTASRPTVIVVEPTGIARPRCSRASGRQEVVPCSASATPLHRARRCVSFRAPTGAHFRPVERPTDLRPPRTSAPRSITTQGDRRT